MPDQLFMYYIEKLLVMICINNGSGGMVIRLEIETWLIGKGGTKRGGAKRRQVREVVRGLLSFVALMCVRCVSAVTVEGA
jgi:hypothetical protein